MPLHPTYWTFNGKIIVTLWLSMVTILASPFSLSVSREAISLVCEAVPGTKGALRKRKVHGWTERGRREGDGVMPTLRERELVSTAHVVSIIAFLPPQRRRGSHFLCALLRWSSMNRCLNIFTHLFIHRCLLWTNVSFRVLCPKQSDVLQT